MERVFRGLLIKAEPAADERDRQQRFFAERFLQRIRRGQSFFFFGQSPFTPHSSRFTGLYTLHGFKQHDQGVKEIIGEDLQGVVGEVVAKEDLCESRQTSGAGDISELVIVLI